MSFPLLSSTLWLRKPSRKPLKESYQKRITDILDRERKEHYFHRDGGEIPYVPSPKAVNAVSIGSWAHIATLCAVVPSTALIDLP